MLAHLKFLSLPLLLAALLAAPASAQTSTATISAAEKTAECIDFLAQLNKKPAHLIFENCTTETSQGADVYVANYKVAGKHASVVESYFVKTAGMPKMRRNCCIWESFSASNAKHKTNRGVLRANKKTYEVSMGSDTAVSRRSQWSRVPSFDVTVTLYRDEP
jgi:hypothetical protein